MSFCCIDFDAEWIKKAVSGSKPADRTKLVNSLVQKKKDGLRYQFDPDNTKAKDR